MPFNLSMTHLAVVGIVALVVLGPERLPSVARTAGGLYREWQRIRGDLQGEVREVISEFREPFLEQVRGVVDEVRSPAPPISELPALDGGSANFSPGPELRAEVPQLGPPPAPGTFVPYEP